MLPLAVIFATLLGLGIGSFSNVVIYRVPRGESIVSPPSACPNCGHPIRARHNVPVVGWLWLRGKCADCGEPISARYPLIEAAMGLAFGVIVAVCGFTWATPLLLVFAAFSIILAAIDLDVHKLPYAIVGPFAVAVAVVLLAAAIVTGDWGQLVRALIGAAIVGLIYFLAWFVYPAGLGFGDVTLAPVLGALMAWFGWGQLAVGTFAGFLWGALFGLVMMVVTKRSRKHRIPFGPWMLLGAWTGIVVGDAVAGWYLDVMLSA